MSRNMGASVRARLKNRADALENYNLVLARYGLEQLLYRLRQVLPAQSESGIQRMLNELRSEGRVFLRGKRRWARWVIVRG